MSAIRGPGEDAGAYASAGVDIAAADAIKRHISELIATTLDARTLGIGSFGSMFRLGSYRDPVLVSSCDGVGTKLKIAALMDRHSTVGRDIVNHCIDDILCSGAMPLFFLDYMASAHLAPRHTAEVIAGMSEACREAGVALIGGETAEMPGFYSPGVYDLVGFIVGVVERDRVIDGRAIREGDVVLGVPSSGLHTNGYSLVRRVFDIDAHPEVLTQTFPGLTRPLGDVLLVPHLSYHAMLAPYLHLVHGIAHITGGGFQGNVPRVLPEGLAAEIETGSWEVPALFRLIQEKGSISTVEMYRVFNMGVGLVVIVALEDASQVAASIPAVYSIGRIVERRPGCGGVILK